MRGTKNVTVNAIIAALYTAIALFVPSTAFANFRVSTALYVLAAWNPALIPGLALGNAIAGLANGFLDVVMGWFVGLITAWTAWKLGERWAWVAVLVVPTLMVPTWLAWMFNVPYLATVLVLIQGQAVSALLGWVILRARAIKHLIGGDFSPGRRSKHGCGGAP